MQARDNKLTIEDMAGGTFTISNVSASDPAAMRTSEEIANLIRAVSLAP